MVDVRGRSMGNEKGNEEAKGTEVKGLSDEELSQRETSGVFGAQTHRPTAVHYKGGCGVGSKEKNRYDLRSIDDEHCIWSEWR